jgi:hypothetical protein
MGEDMVGKKRVRRCVGLYKEGLGELKIAEKRRNVFIIDSPKDFLGG